MEGSQAVATLLFLAALFLDAKSQITFMNEPQDTQAVAGGSAMFTCTVESEEEFEITWSFNGETLQPGQKYNIPDDGTSLTITNIADADLGEYSCQVEDAGTGETIEASATLSLAVFATTFSPNQPPTISSTIGESIIIPCVHINSNPAPTIVMMKDGSPLPTDSRFTLVDVSLMGPNGEMQHGLMLTISPTEATDSGVYQCTATNSLFPGVTATGPTTVVTISGNSVAPTITNAPLNHMVTEGESVTLQCTATGTPSPTISWLKDGDAIESSSEVTIVSTPGTSTLTITSVLASNLGEYACVATNGGGSVSATATIAFTVTEVFPVIVQSPQSVTVASGGTAALMCAATGTPTPTITWQKDGLEVLPSADISIVSADGNSTLTISNAKMTDAGLYECNAANTAGTVFASGDISVTAGNAPSFIQDPMSTTAAEGSFISFTCAASGSPTITWQKDGVAIVPSPSITVMMSGDMSTLTLSSVTSTDAGSYSCVASNAQGSATSASATLTLEMAGMAPRIQEPPQDITVSIGQMVQLSCSATGDPTPTIQWFLNGITELLSNADLTVTSIGGSSNLTIHSIQASDAAIYECRAENSAGIDSAIATITVSANPPPTFTQHPASSTVSIGSQATFTCSATGSPTIAWQKDGVAVSPSPPTVTITTSGGMSTLTLSSVTSTDAGSYSCSATNVGGSANSNTAILTVNTASIDMMFQLEPSDTFGILGQTGLISCLPPNSVPPAVVQWLKDSSPITDSRFTVASNGSLLISSVMSDDAGQYVCTATNQVLDITRNSSAAQFQVFVVPAITQSPQSVSIGVGASFTLSCSASGNPTPSFTWSKDGNTLANDGSHIVINGGTVTVSNVVQSDVGTYTCVAANSVGSAQANALVTILSPPSFNLTSDTVTAIVGSSVVLPCHATPDPSLSFSWSLAGQQLPQQQVLSNGGLSITSVAQSNEGVYTCTATNTLGNAQGTVQLTVNAPPTAVAAQSSVTATEGQTAQLVCTVTGDPSPTVTWQSGGVTIPNSNTPTITAQNSGATLVFSPVQLSNAGSYQCTASNGVGSPASATVTLSVLSMPFPPTVSLTPAVSLTLGDSFTLNCQPAGNPVPTVTWTKNGIAISSSTPRITVTGGVVTITGATLTEAGLYRCQAQNSLGSATATTSITVNVPPQLTLSTPDLTTDEGSTTILNCQATGNPTPIITWSKNAAIFPNTESPRATVAPNNSLIITGTQQGDAGDYVCQASNTAGTVSYTVSLSVNSIFSTFIDSPASSMALTGQPLTLSCLLHNNPPLPPTVQWTKNNVTLSSSNRVQITYSPSTGSAQYHITSVLYADAGIYHCVALDGQGETLFTSGSGTLTVQGIPAFETILQSQTVSITSTAQFICNVLSDPTATVTWSFNGAQISNSDKYTITSSSLSISNVQMSDDGYYQCQAVNTFGTNQTIAKLTVTEPINLPVVSITEGSTTSVMAGILVTLHCTVNGGDISSIQWRKATSGGGSSVVSEGVSLSSSGATLTFPSIAMTDGGNYQCVANNSAGSSSAGIQLNVNVVPQLQLSVTTLTYDVGQQLPSDQGPLCTAVAGSPQPEIVWTGPSGSQQASNNGRLVIAGMLQPSSGGTYTCRGINLAGEDTAIFTLVINTGPMIIVPPQDRDITQGETVLLPCIAQGKPSPTIQWSKTQGQLPNGAVTSLFGLQLFSVSMTDGGTYQCTATNEVTAISNFANVVVHAPPLVNTITPNERQYLLTGSAFTISCTVTASPSINVRWYHNSSLLSATPDGRIRFMGDQLRTLSISNTILSDSGSYVCNVSSSVNFDAASVMVTVGTNPSIVTTPPNVDLAPGDSFFLPCIATGVPLPTLSWSRTTETGEEQQLALIGPNYHIETQGLRINSAERGDTGNYHCMADNKVSTAMFSSRVRVEGAPQATNITPTVMTVSQAATLTCHILYGYPNPSFTWRRADGTLVPPGRTFVNGNGQLVFTTVLEEDAGDYECLPTNQYGGTGFTQSISVWVIPNITFPENPVTGVLDDTITLTCPVTGSPTPSVSWRLPNGNTPPGNPTELTVGPPLSVANEGNYTCVTENSAGSVNKSLELQIRGAAPSTISINVLSSTSLFMFWTPPVPGNQLQSYNVSYGVADLPERTSRMELTTFLSLFNLEEFTVYEFTIRGMFFNGVEGLPLVSTATTLEALPSGSPRNLELVSYIEAMEIRWQLPSRFDQNGIIRGFLIDYRVTPLNNASNTTFTNQLNVTVNSTDTLDTVYQLNLTGLIGDESYDVRILAYNTLGLGPHTNVMSIRTQRPFPLGLVLGVSISVGAVVLAVLLVLLVIFFIWAIRRCIKARQFSPGDTEKGRLRSKKRRTKEDVSDPHPEIPPDIDDNGRSGKFIIQRKDGSTISSQPRVIKKSDVAKKRKTGATVVSRQDSVMRSDEYEPYEVPVDTIKPAKGGKAKKVGKKHKGNQEDTQPLTNSRPSIYDDDIDPYATTHPVIPPSKPDKKEEERTEVEIEDLPVELPVRLEDLPVEEPVRLEDLQQEAPAEEPESEEEEEEAEQQQEEEEEEWGEDDWEKEYQRRRSRVHDDDQDQPYATVSVEHREMKRSKKLKEQMKEDKQKRKEEEKMAAAKKKQQQKARKEAEKKQKKAMKERQKRASLGLDNNLSLSQLGYGGGGRAFDSATATMF